MSVWLACPSKRPPAEAEPIFAKWRERGYKIAIVTDDATWRGCDVQIIPPEYKGYAKSVNVLVEQIIKQDPDAEWIIAAADDIEPDPNHTAEEIAAECSDHFAYHNSTGPQMYHDTWKTKGLFGVMQPTGDRWGDAQGPYIDRVAGSAWLGREFCQRINQGRGPIWPEYFHMGEDEELQAVAIQYGVFWQRPDLIQYHAHWGRPREGEKMGQASRMPEFLREANSPEHWAKYKKLFAERKAAGFPGSEPL